MTGYKYDKKIMPCLLQEIFLSPVTNGKISLEHT